MEKGFGRGWFRRLGGALAALAMVPPAVLAGGGLRKLPPPGRPWWDVSLTVSVHGAYVIRAPGPPVSGTYTYRARWKGRLELDSADDLLLVHLGTEVLEWSLRQTRDADAPESVLGPADQPAPSLRVDYLIKDGAEIEFVFRLGEIPVPLDDPDLAAGLDLPRSSSRQAGPPGHGYADFVKSGSCRIAIPKDDLKIQAPERRFAWEWSREREAGSAARLVRIAHRHSAEAIVSVVIH